MGSKPAPCRASARRAAEPLFSHLDNFQLFLGCLYELADGHIDELVLGLCLHHPRSLGSHHLDGLLDVNVTVQP